MHENWIVHRRLVTSENLFYPSVAKWRTGKINGIAFAGEPHRLTVLNFSKPLPA
jgi:hypothetical protein